MEIIKKKIKQILTTGTTIGCTKNNNCFVIIPDLNVSYYFKLCLISESIDIGFFDAAIPAKSYYPYGQITSGEEIPIGLNNLL